MNEVSLNNFRASLDRFEEVLAEPKSTIMVRDAAIQRFEFTLELAWKIIQRVLREEEIVCTSPKRCLKEAFKQGLVADEPEWIAMVRDRNLTVHTYTEETAQAVFERLPAYLPRLQTLYTNLTKRLCDRTETTTPS